MREQLERRAGVPLPLGGDPAGKPANKYAEEAAGEKIGTGKKA